MLSSSSKLHIKDVYIFQPLDSPESEPIDTLVFAFSQNLKLVWKTRCCWL